MEKTGMSSLAIFMAIVIAACSACGILLVAVLAISWGIHREDRKDTLTGPPPDWACWCTRRAAGFHRLRWNSLAQEADDSRTRSRVP
jgi:hypothetical protein